MVYDIAQHYDPEDLNEDDYKDFLRVFGSDVSVADSHDGRCAKVKRVEIEEVFVGFVNV